MIRYYLYRHIRIDKNEVFYVGIGQKMDINYDSLEKEYERAYDKNSRSKFWNRIINKTLYKVEIIFECDTLEEVYEKEKEYIKLYGRRDLGKGTLVNLTDGGDGTYGLIFTKEHLQKLKDKSVQSILKRRKYLVKPVYQYNSINGEFIKKWDSAVDAAKYLNVCKSTISSCAKSQSHYASNYLWFMDFQGEFVTPFSGIRKLYNGVIMLDKETEEEIIKFDRIEDAYKFLNKSHSGHIRRACKNKGQVSYGYKWKEVSQCV